MKTNTLNKIVAEKKEVEERMKNNFSFYQEEIKKMKTKEINLKSYKEVIMKLQINIENEIRKHFGFCTKHLISGLEKVNSENANRIMVIIEEN